MQGIFILFLDFLAFLFKKSLLTDKNHEISRSARNVVVEGVGGGRAAAYPLHKQLNVCHSDSDLSEEESPPHF